MALEKADSEVETDLASEKADSEVETALAPPEKAHSGSSDHKIMRSWKHWIIGLRISTILNWQDPGQIIVWLMKPNAIFFEKIVPEMAMIGL